MRSRRSRARRRATRSERHAYAVQAVATVGILAVVAIAIWQFSADGSRPDSTTLVLLALVIFLLVAVALPKTVVAAVNRINNLDILGVKIELQVNKAHRIVDSFPADEDEVPVPSRPQAEDPRAELGLVAKELKRKLRFVRDAILDDPSSLAEPFVVAHLEYMQLFREDEAELCHKVLSRALGDEIPHWDASDRVAFLDDAWRFAWRFATRMFNRYARQALKREGWLVADFEQSRKHRADFLVRHEGHWAVVAARVAAPRKTVRSTAARLARSNEPIEDAQRIVVVPDRVRHLWGPLDKGPMPLADGRVIAARLTYLIENPELLAGGDRAGSGADATLSGRE